MADIFPSVPGCPGWYGKIPSLGDFASRRLPQNFIDVWHDWLQQGMAASRASLGERWLDLYLNSPIWRFLLTPGIYGEFMWAGTLMPSVDKVGRYFPLTLAVDLNANVHSLSEIATAQEWYAILEQLSLGMLDATMSADDLELGLKSVPFPTKQVSSATTGQELARWWLNDVAGPKVIHLSQSGTICELIEHAAQDVLKAMGSSMSLWWTGDKPQLHCFRGLPAVSQFSVLLGDR